MWGSPHLGPIWGRLGAWGPFHFGAHFWLACPARPRTPFHNILLFCASLLRPDWGLFYLEPVFLLDLPMGFLPEAARLGLRPRTTRMEPFPRTPARLPASFLGSPTCPSLSGHPAWDPSRDSPSGIPFQGRPPGILSLDTRLGLLSKDPPAWDPPGIPFPGSQDPPTWARAHSPASIVLRHIA